MKNFIRPRLAVPIMLLLFPLPMPAQVELPLRIDSLNSMPDDRQRMHQVDRYIAWPGQALAYKIGELKIKELRAQAEQQLGEAFDIRAFHDALLEEGALPLDILEAKMMQWIERQR